MAGVVSVFSFTAIHHFLISNIWSMLMIMVVAGAICGLCIGWSYGRLFESQSVSSWLRYNTAYLAMFGLLGAVSALVFEPVTTVAAIMELNGPVDDLIVQALPMTITFTFATAGLIIVLFGRAWSDAAAILLTTAVLVLFLGLNISVIGLVEFSAGSVYLVAEMFGLVLTIGVVYVAVFATLEWKSLASG